MAKSKNIFAEMASKLRAVSNTVLTWSLTGSIGSAYALKSSKMNYSKTKELYYNTLDDYKLGASFAKPVINIAAGFCGLPTFIMQDKKAQQLIDAYTKTLANILLIAQRNSFRDGDSYVRFMRLKNNVLLYKGQETSIQAALIAPDTVTIVPDPLTADEQQYIIKTHIKYNIDADRYDFTVVETITATKHTVTYSGNSIPADLKAVVEVNEWGFIPIVHFKNNAEPDELYGRSDLEVIEPLIKAYHDVLLQGLQSNKLNSTPKVKLKLNDVAAFLKHNFSEAQIAAAKKTGQLKFNKDLYLLNVDEEIGFVEVKSAVGSADALLQFLFYCIVDASQTPEFAFGTAVSSSKASVEQQLIPLQKKLLLKRTESSDSYKKIARILLAMTAKITSTSVTTYDSTLQWQAVSPADAEKTATVLKTTSEALASALDHEIVSHQAATEYLATLIPFMHDYTSTNKDEVSEKQRITEGQAFTDRLNAGQAADVIEKGALNNGSSSK